MRVYQQYSIIFLIGLLSVISSYGQETGKDFTVVSSGFVYSGESLAISSTITKNGQSITWKQEKGGNSYSMIFTVSSFSGQWDLSSGHGSGTYSLEHEGKTGVLSLSKTDQTMALLSLDTPQGSVSYTFSSPNLTLR